jgi:hypothetical protein
VVLDAGSLPWSEMPSRRCSTGSARTSITTAATVASAAGRRCTVSAHLVHAPSASVTVAAAGCAPRRPRCRRLSTRRPKTPSSAGSSVSAASTVQATVSAQAIASPLRKLKPRTRMPSMQTQTVLPANRTARPEVSIAVTAASCGLRPAFRPRRCLVTMNSA